MRSNVKERGGKSSPGRGSERNKSNRMESSTWALDEAVLVDGGAPERRVAVGKKKKMELNRA